ncbi:hypothetical protein J1N35_007862 [Gossypium stocksii]|uniref:Uncharacterized protein n=1 Tax=Gossypium stocksii TaxID=47602 RepID=A0A9D3W764_9ROSI|nr:hypothetical protein J1N35_007862 [Gossypium stocksii]
MRKERECTQSIKQEPKKTESISIEIDCEDEEEVNPLVAPPVDSIAVIPLPYTKPITE